MGQKLVTQDIRTASGTLAYTRGMLIEDDAVKANGWDDYVVGRDTLEARRVLSEITGDSLDEPAQVKSTAKTSTTDKE